MLSFKLCYSNNADIEVSKNQPGTRVQVRTYIGSVVIAIGLSGETSVLFAYDSTGL